MNFACEMSHYYNKYQYGASMFTYIYVLSLKLFGKSDKFIYRIGQGKIK